MIFYQNCFGGKGPGSNSIGEKLKWNSTAQSVGSFKKFGSDYSARNLAKNLIRQA